MKRLVAILIICLAFLTGSGDTLWWQVDDTATVDSIPIITFLDNNFPEDDNHWIEARVVMTINGESHIANIAYPDFPGERFESAYVGFIENTDPPAWGTGKWSTQSPLHEISGYERELLEEAQFMVELGEMSYDDVLDVVSWETIANSETVFGS